VKDKPNFSGRWGIKKLGDVAELNPKTAKDILPDDLEVDFIPMRLVEEKTGGIAEPEKRKFHSVKQGYVSFANNDILFAKVTPCMENGKIAIVNNLNNNIGFGSSEFHVIRVSEQILNSFLFYFLIRDKFRSEAAANMTGAVGLRRVPKQFLENYRLPVPPLSEQKQIVDKIEELFSELDAGRRQLESVKGQLRTYCQAVLKSAFEGRFTYNNIKDGEMPRGWNWKILGNVCSKIQDGSHFSPKIQYDTPGKDRFKYITAKNIRNNHLDLSNLTYVDRQFHTVIFKRCNPEYGDVLMTKDGVNTGEVTINTLNEEVSLLSSVCLFKPKKELLNSSFLKYFFQSPFGSQIINESMTGTAIKRIILKNLRNANIVMPPIDEQVKIISEIDSRMSVCDKNEETINNSLQLIEVLKQSILKQAFEGKLEKTQTT
jgi:type I restriction enzyme S subunit